MEIKPVGQNEVVAALDAALGEARAGRLLAIGLVKTYGPGQVMSVNAGPALAETYLGCGLLQGAVLNSMMQKPSPIVRPAGYVNGAGQQ